MLNRNRPYGTICGLHEFNAFFEQDGKLYSSHGYEIDKITGEQIEGPQAHEPPVVPLAEGVVLTPAPAPMMSTLSVLPPEPVIEQLGPGEETGQGEEEPQPIPPEPRDIVYSSGLNLSSWARGELPEVEFRTVKPIIKEMFNKNVVNSAQAISVINAGLPE